MFDIRHNIVEEMLGYLLVIASAVAVFVMYTAVAMHESP